MIKPTTYVPFVCSFLTRRDQENIQCTEPPAEVWEYIWIDPYAGPFYYDGTIPKTELYYYCAEHSSKIRTEWIAGDKEVEAKLGGKYYAYTFDQVWKVMNIRNGKSE